MEGHQSFQPIHNMIITRTVQGLVVGQSCHESGEG